MQIPVTQQPLIPPGQTGFYDIPFIYALNYFFPKTGAGSNPLIDITGFANTNWRDVIPSQGDYEFHLRRHIPSYDRSFNLLDASQNQLYSPYDLNPDAHSTAAGHHQIRGDILIQPDLVYPPGAGIRVMNTNGFAFSGLDSFWYGYYLMQGAKRIFKAPNLTPSYPFTERSYTYTLPFTLLQAYPWQKTFYVPILNYDWEFQAVYYTVGYGNNPTVPGNTIGFQAKLYDPGRFAMMSDYVDIEILTLSSKIGLTGCFPTPPIIYPQGSQLQVDIQSTALAADVPATVNLNFVGLNRVPCRT